MIGFAPIQTTNSYSYFILIRIDELWIYLYFTRRIILQDQPLLMFEVLDPNRSHIHPSTHSSPLGASSKSGRFCTTPQLLSRFSNKLLICRHVQRRKYSHLVQTILNHLENLVIWQYLTIKIPIILFSITKRKFEKITFEWISNQLYRSI